MRSHDSDLYRWPDNVHSFIIDGEIVVVSKDGKFMNFQEIDRRFDSHAEDKQPQVLIFDILALNGKNLCDWQLKYRKKILAKTLKLYDQPSESCIKGGYFKRLKEATVDEIKRIETFSKELNCEGLVIKQSNSIYDTSGKRSAAWMKLKTNMLQTGLSDTVDLVPIGAFYGKGARAGIFGAYLLASFNKQSGVFEAACKVGTGFSQASL